MLLLTATIMFTGTPAQIERWCAFFLYRPACVAVATREYRLGFASFVFHSFCE